MTETEPRLIGQFERTDGKAVHIQGRFDKVALIENNVVFISLVAFAQDVKALKAAFATGLDSPIHLKNVTLERDGEGAVPGDVRSRLGLEQALHREETNDSHINHRFAGANLDAGGDSFRAIAPTDCGSNGGEVAVETVAIAGEKRRRVRHAVPEAEAKLDEGLTGHSHDCDFAIDQHRRHDAVHRRGEVDAIAFQEFGTNTARSQLLEQTRCFVTRFEFARLE
jgi:hypothetical protein